MKVWRLPHLIDALYVKIPVERAVIAMVTRAVLDEILEIGRKGEALHIPRMGTLYPHTHKFWSNVKKDWFIVTHYKFREVDGFRRKMKHMRRKISDAKPDNDE